MSSPKKGKSVTSDRAAKISRNPIFKKPKILSRNAEQNILQDDRFSAMFNDPKFEVSSKDKRGRPTHFTNRQLTPAAFYGLKGKQTKKKSDIDDDDDDKEGDDDDDDDKEGDDGDDDEGEKSDDQDKEEGADDEGSDDDDSDDSDVLPARVDLVRGIGFGGEVRDTSDSELDEDDAAAPRPAVEDDADSLDDADDAEDDAEDEQLPAPAPPLLVDAATHRLAVQHLDWSIIRARDLLVLFRSFCPEGGQVRGVSVLPSAFGMERLAVERVSGPPELAALREREAAAPSQDETARRRALQRAVRRYQSLLQRYYFGVVECDSAATADALYETLEGYEFEKSGCTLELSFVPEAMRFEVPEEFQECVTRCERAPRNYKLNPFFSKAKMHKNIATEQLSWDAQPEDRARYVSHFFREDADLEQLEQDDMLGQVLALSSSGGSEAEEEDGAGGSEVAALRRKLAPRLGAAEMRALLLGDDDDGEAAARDSDSDEMATDEEEELMQYVDDFASSDDDATAEANLKNNKKKTTTKKAAVAAAEKDVALPKGRKREQEERMEEEDAPKKKKKSVALKKKKKTRKGDVSSEDEDVNSTEAATEDAAEKKGPRAEKRQKLKPSQLSSEHQKAHRRKKKRRLEEQLTEADQDGELALLLHSADGARRKPSTAEQPAQRAAEDPRFAALQTDARFRLDPNAPDFRSAAAAGNGVVAELLVMQQQQLGAQQSTAVVNQPASLSGAGLTQLSRQVLADMGTAPPAASRQKLMAARRKAAPRDNASVLNFVEMAAAALQQPPANS